MTTDTFTLLHEKIHSHEPVFVFTKKTPTYEKLVRAYDVRLDAHDGPGGPTIEVRCYHFGWVPYLGTAENGEY